MLKKLNPKQRIAFAKLFILAHAYGQGDVMAEITLDGLDKSDIEFVYETLGEKCEPMFSGHRNMFSLFKMLSTKYVSFDFFHAPAYPYERLKRAVLKKKTKGEA